MLVYDENLAKTMNDICSPKKIAATAKKFVALEKKHGPYSFGKFLRLATPQAKDYANWEKDAGGIPESIQSQLTDVIGTNLRSASPLPVVLKVGENVDGTHDLHVKTFAHKGNIHIGLLMLCPNTKLK